MKELYKIITPNSSVLKGVILGDAGAGESGKTRANSQQGFFELKPCQCVQVAGVGFCPAAVFFGAGRPAQQGLSVFPGQAACISQGRGRGYAKMLRWVEQAQAASRFEDAPAFTQGMQGVTQQEDDVGGGEKVEGCGRKWQGGSAAQGYGNTGRRGAQQVVISIQPNGLQVATGRQ